jgi:zinc transporter ZupT
MFGSALLTVTYRLADSIPKTPRIIEIANRALPRNISFDAYLLVTLLTPFIIFLISSKKTMKGMIESVLHFSVGIMAAGFLMIIGWSNIQKTFASLSFNRKWTGELLVAFLVAALVSSFVYLLVRYGL